MTGPTDERIVAVLRVVTLASRSGKYGGPTDTALRQADLLANSKYRVRVVAGAFAGDEPTAPIVTKRVRQWIPGTGYSGLFSLSVARTIVRARGAADVFHVSIARELIPIWAAVVALASRTPLVLQPHGMLTSRSSSWHRLADLFLRPLVRRATMIIALTDLEQLEVETWLGAGRVPPMRVVGNPSPSISLAPQSKRSALFAARLHPRKRVGDFLEAARLSEMNGDGVQFSVFGPDQGDGGVVRDAARDLACVDYGGAVEPERVLYELESAGVFVLPSWNEPWGNVVATAVKSGIPVVLTKSAALASELEEMRAAVVVPDGEPRALRDAIVGVLDNRETFVASIDIDAVRSRFANAGIAAQIQEVYEKALSGEPIAHAERSG